MGAMQAGAISQVLFAKPDGMQIRWDVAGGGQFDSIPLVVPQRQNFPQGGIFRLKLTNIPAREGVELYPTLEVGPTTPRTEAFLSHNAIPIQFTEEDFDQVLTGNFVTKVIYLPDPEFQEMALAGVETLVSTRLDPGVDPVVEADRRGAILAIVRVGNLDVQLPPDENGVVPASFNFMAQGMAGGGQAAAFQMQPTHISGVSAPSWGHPMTGTPIGLVGPPHVPLGGPAGLRRHVIANDTRMHFPDPTKKVNINVAQRPGMSYPAPVNRARILEQTIRPMPVFH